MDIFIVDDNPSIRKFLLQIIPTLSKEYRIIGVAASVEEGLISLEVQKPDLLILDVELPDGKGFDILQKLSEKNEKGIFEGNVIFATAHDHYALRAIKYSALDYLLKPIDPEALEQALLKAVQQIKNKQLLQDFTQQKINTLRQNLENVEQNEENIKAQKIVLSDAEKIYLVSVEEIMRCESNGNYTFFYLTENRTITITQSIKVFEQMLPKSIFYRVHRSHLMNLNFFEFLDKKDGGTIHLKDGSTLPVAVRRKDELLERLKSIK
ncbi:LytR/AlgR family response regulator transcription factor [Bernardetia sp.]|uniref:LytR/AlgR family response regulator transcription factor n=1 Tax=Bernardetia sp. TaxID=1937974 RepID=UPI0025C59DF2|nr:LytTR family DNA-binding domain-containing protein [Bernardetia sp.]